MNWLSKNAEALVEICTKNTDKARGVIDATVDVAVVGSGYGGAVAALRFAEYGESVYVLERGREYVAGEFPNDLSQIGKHVRSEVAALSGISTKGYEDGLFDFRIGLRAGALVGNGLGGGSLINAGVGLQPDPRVFKRDDWPSALQQADLKKYYELASDTLELQTSDATAVVDIKKTEKYKRLHALYVAAHKAASKQKKGPDRKVVVSFVQVPIAVQLHHPKPNTLGLRKACNQCGDCVTGCNNHAKLSLTATYLPLAVEAGAEIFTGLTVLRVSHEPLGNEKFPWVVHFLRTDERKLQHDIDRHVDPSQPPKPAADSKNWVYRLRARRVVLGAGTFGSSEILLRSRSEGLEVSNTALGMGISGNGDDVAFGFDLKDEANAVGWGSKAANPPPNPALTPVGPTITGAIRFHDPQDHKRSTLTQDGSVPGLMGGAVHELLTTLGTLTQMGNLYIRSKHGGDPLTLKPQALKNSLTLLGMGHDTAGGVMVFDHKSDRIGWGWPKAADETTPELHKNRMKACVEELGGLYIQNPAVSAIPDSMSNVLNGPKPGGALFTVHPLGGCRMGDTMLEGVVNHWGAVWKENGKVHDGLYVLDGSTIPSSLGVNPMLTITALAERSCEMILLGMAKKDPNPKARLIPDDPVFPVPLQVLQGVHASTLLAEVLRGSMTAPVRWPLTKGVLQLTDWLRSCVGPDTANTTAPLSLLFKNNVSVDVALFLQFDIGHWQQLMDCETHTVNVVIPLDGEESYQSSKIRFEIKNAGGLHPENLKVTGGKVSLFSQRKGDWLSAACRWMRTGLTYGVGRWLPDYFKNRTLRKLQKKSESGAEDSKPWSWCSAIKLIGHANEAREFTYEIKLEDTNLPPNHYILRGKKTFEAAASWRALFKQAVSVFAGGWRAVQRRSLWQQLTELQAELYICQGSTTQSLIASGRLAMDLPDMMRRVMPQLGRNRDSLNALLEFASYPMLFLRVILRSRLLDFRLPDYKTDSFGKPDLPKADPALIDRPPGYFELDHVSYPELKYPIGSITKAKIYRLDVPLTKAKSNLKAAKKIRIGLVRYPAQNPRTHDAAAGLVRVKTIVLINGFLLSTKAFVAEELETTEGGSLATTLHKAGWDVWMFEYRASPLLDASAINSNIDDIAEFDIPAAIDKVIEVVSTEQCLDFDNTQIFAYSRCVGSAALSMSLFSGRLKHKNGSDKLAGVQLSDFQPFLVGSPSAQMRLQLASFLSGAFNLDFLQFTAGTMKADLLHALMDRAFASAHYAYRDEVDSHYPPRPATKPKPPYAYPEEVDSHYMHEVAGQRCPGEYDLRKPQHDTTTCKRISGLMSRSYHHDRLSPETHAKLDEYFGRGNLGVFLQGTKCVEYERLVDADGQNVYVSDIAIRNNLQMPLMLMHGGKNALFDPESLSRSEEQLKRILGDGAGLNRYELLPNFGHVDLILGKDAPKHVFPVIGDFFQAAFTAPKLPKPLKPNRCRARLPRTGPIVGWVRPAGKDKTLIRIWIEIDDSHADTPLAALTVVTYGGNTPSVLQAWNVQPSLHNVTYAVADVEVPTDSVGSMTLQMFGLHSYRGPEVPNAPATGLPPEWGIPMTCADLSPPTGNGPGARLAPGQTPLSLNTPLLAGAFERFGEQVAATTATIVSNPDEPITESEGFLGIRFEPPVDIPSSAQLPINTDEGLSVPTEQPPFSVPLASQEVPLLIEPGSLDRANFISPMELEVSQNTALTAMANPNTLSRQRRTLRNMSQRVVTLGSTVVENKIGCIRFFAAACRHPGLSGFEFDRADASLLKVVAAVKTSQPRFMLMVGDQIYADARAGLMDIETPIEKFLSKYRNAFGSSAGFRKLAQILPVYMVIDDHEINDDWSQEQALADEKAKALAETACATFKAYQYVHGPGSPSMPNDLLGQSQSVEGFNYSYTHNELPFIVLDTRTQRQRVPDRKMMHTTQWQWMETWLLAEKEKGSHPKFVISGSVLAPGLSRHHDLPAPRRADTWQMAPDERIRLLSFISDNDIDNVVFISSDYHCSAAATITFKDNKKVKAWAIVAPPIHAPLRFANSEADEVLQDEDITLNSGTAQIRSKAWDGDGWLEVDVARQPTGGHTISLSFHLRRLEQAKWSQTPTVCTWAL